MFLTAFLFERAIMFADLLLDGAVVATEYTFDHLHRSHRDAADHQYQTHSSGHHYRCTSDCSLCQSSHT